MTTLKNLIEGLYTLHATGKANGFLYEAMDYDYWIYLIEDDVPVGPLACTYEGCLKPGVKAKTIDGLSEEVRTFITTATPEVWKELYEKSWKLWNKHYR